MFRSHVVQLPGTQHLTHRFCAYRSSSICGSLHHLPAFACVAVHSIPVATTEQRVLLRVFSGVVAVESAAVRVCRGLTNIRFQDVDIMTQTCPTNVEWRSWRTGCLWQQLAIDTTLVSVLGRDGLPRWRTSTVQFSRHAPRRPRCGNQRPMVSRIRTDSGAASHGKTASRAKGWSALSALG